MTTFDPTGGSKLAGVLLNMYSAAGLDDFRTRTLETIHDLFGGELACHNEINLLNGESLSMLSEPIDGFAMLRPAFFEHVEQHPSVQHHLVADGRDTRAVRISDFVNQRRWRGTGLYQDFYRPLADVRYQLTIGQKIDDSLIFVAVSRKQFDFTDQERACMTALRPHFLQAYRNAKCRSELERLRGCVPEASAVLSGEAAVFAMMSRFGLSRREAEVLLLIAQGLTNGEIADSLRISISTVKTRVENIFRQLEVESRTAAALRVLRPPVARMAATTRD